MMKMPELDLKEGIKMEVLEAESASEAECGSGACGCGCESEQEATDQLLTVVAGGSAEGCCEPGCGPDTCGSS
jgi:diaminopimelate epimerase